MCSSKSSRPQDSHSESLGDFGAEGMSWRTNRKTKKPFLNPLGNDLDHGRSKVEVEPEDQSDFQQDETYFCVVCLQEKSGSHLTLNGEDCCAQCLNDYRSGRMQAEDAY